MDAGLRAKFELIYNNIIASKGKVLRSNYVSYKLIKGKFVQVKRGTTFDGVEIKDDGPTVNAGKSKEMLAKPVLFHMDVILNEKPLYLLYEFQYDIGLRERHTRKRRQTDS